MTTITTWVTTRPWLAAVPVLVVVWVFGRDQLFAWRHRRLITGARWVTIAAPPDVTPRAAAAFWITMVGVLTPSVWRRRLYGHPHVGWEYTWTGRTLTIRVWVPGVVPPGAVEAAIRSAWPAATVEVSDATAPIPLSVVEQAGGAHWPAQPDTIPLRGDHDDDPLRPLVAAGSEVRDREHACVQVLARPASARTVRAARRAATTGGHPSPDLLSRTVEGVAALAAQTLIAIVDTVTPGPSHHRTSNHRTPNPAGRAGERDPVRDATTRTMVDKATRVPHYEIAIRYAVAADPDHHPTDPDRRQQIKRRLAGLGHIIASATAVHTGPNRLRRLTLTHPVAVLAERSLRHGFLATVTELSALAALPQDLAVPGLNRARAKAMPAPVTVPTGGRNTKVLGRAQIGGHSVALPVVDARQHMHIIGKTGVGKSTLLLNLILGDVKAGRGTIVIDPRGDLITDILDRLPATHANRIVIIDPDQPNPGCFNPLEDNGDPHLTVDNLVGIFAKIFQRHWGPRIDDTLRVACLDADARRTTHPQPRPAPAQRPGVPRPIHPRP